MTALLWDRRHLVKIENLLDRWNIEARMFPAPLRMFLFFESNFYFINIRELREACFGKNFQPVAYTGKSRW